MNVNILSVITNLFLYLSLLFATNITLDKFVLALAIFSKQESPPLDEVLCEWFQNIVSCCSLVTSYVYMLFS